MDVDIYSVGEIHELMMMYKEDESDPNSSGMVRLKLSDKVHRTPTITQY